jgi:hypothetical protein
VAQGGRRGDAVAALSELEVLAAQTPALGASTEPSAAQETQSPTRLMISSSVKGAKISLNGGTPVETQLIEEVKPGPHKVRVTAEGYFDEVQEVTATPGNLAPFKIVLREKPARVSLTAPSGAGVLVDGVLKASTPLSAPLAIPSGVHTIALTKRGHITATRELDVKRDENETIEMRLHVTTQRIVSYVLIGAGALGVAGGGVFAVFAAGENDRARKIDQERIQGGIGTERLAEYQAAIEQRDKQRLFAGALLGGGLAVAGAGLAFYTFDLPIIPPPPLRRDEQPDQPSSPSEGFMVTASPVWSPGWTGITLTGRF